MKSMTLPRARVYQGTTYGPGVVDLPDDVARVFAREDYVRQSYTVERKYYDGRSFTFEVFWRPPTRWTRPTAAFVCGTDRERWEAYRALALAELDLLYPADVGP